MKFLLLILIIFLIGVVSWSLQEEPALQDPLAGPSDTGATDTSASATGETVMQPQPKTMGTHEYHVVGNDYSYDWDEIVVTEGDKIHIIFASEQGSHTWVLDEFAVASQRVETGATTEFTFTASTAGAYEFYCSVDDHRAQGMTGTLFVEPN